MINIKDEIQKILDIEQSAAEIIEIYATGSQIFRENPQDLDYVAVLKGYQPKYSRQHIIINEKTYDLMLRDEEEFIKLFNCNLNTNDEGYLHNVLYNYCVCFRDTVYGKWEYNWNIFKNKEKYLKYLKYQYNKTIGKRIKRTKLTKGWVHFYVILKIYENNKVEITPEMLQDIRTLYDTNDGSQIAIIDWIEDEINKI